MNVISCFFFVLFTLVSIATSHITQEPRVQPIMRLSKSYVQTCCAPTIRKSSSTLMQCANSSAHAHMVNILAYAESTKVTTNKLLKSVGIVTFATKKIWEYSAHSLSVNQAYAEHNGYLHTVH